MQSGQPLVTLTFEPPLERVVTAEQPSRAAWVRAAVGVSAAGVLVAGFGALATRPELRQGSFAPDLTVLVIAGILSRRWGIPLPGRGFASFVLAVPLIALLLRGWQFAVVAAALSVLIGDGLVRRLRLGDTLVNVARLTFGTGVVGISYAALGGATGAAALAPDNLLALACVVILMGTIVNATFYLDLALSRGAAWVDPHLTMRWELVVYGASVALGLAWVDLASAQLPVLATLFLIGVLGAATLILYDVIRTAVRADALRLIQRMAGAVAADVSIQRSFARIQALTQQLVPWDSMSFARYNAAADEMEIVAQSGNAGPQRFAAGAGAVSEAVRLRQPMVTTDGRGSQGAGSEVLVPLYQGDDLVGLWSVRYRTAHAYRQADAELLALLGPQLALSLSLSSLVRPLADSSSQAAAYVRQLTATTRAAGKGFAEVTASAAQAEQQARQAVERVSTAVETLGAVVGQISETLRAAREMQETSTVVAGAALDVRSATAQAVDQLKHLGATIDEGAAEVGQLRDAAGEVERFSETISGIAYQTNLLALNATIEAARAGTHGRGFGVVADEVRKLAEESEKAARSIGRSAQDTRKVIDRAARLLEGIGRQLRELAHASGQLGTRLEAIVDTAETTRRTADRAVTRPQETLTLAERAGGFLGEAQAAATKAAEAASAVAANAGERRRIVGELARGAEELSRLAEQLAHSAQFMQGGPGADRA